MAGFEKEISYLRELLHNSKHAVFFGGAGVSTGSGIPDFRGTDGLYTAAPDNGYSPEYMLSCDCLECQPELFFSYYRSNMLYPDARPNSAHTALAELEKEGLIKAVITQNIDGLHQEAGSKNVYELHGTVASNHCVRCGKQYGRDYVANGSGIPVCEECKGTVRPDVVLYGEGLDGATFDGAEREISKSDLLIVGGSSLTVYPAAGLVAGYRGRHLAIINLSPTPYDGRADILIPLSLTEVMPELL